ISTTIQTHTEGGILHLEETESRVKDSSTTLPNKEIKKRSSKSRPSSKGATSSKSVLCNNELHSRIPDLILANSSTLVNISGGDMTSEKLDASYEQKIKRNEEFKSKLTHVVK
ncbi:7938_t:CDS:1, partial [Diversispora eburnea]